MKYLLENPVVGTIGEQKFRTSIEWRNGVLITDEPEKLGGEDLGPDPYTLLLSSLVACTLATLRMYIAYKGLSIEQIRVSANMKQKILSPSGEIVTHIEKSIDFGQEQLEPQLLKTLLKVAENCPVSKILKGTVTITTLAI